MLTEQQAMTTIAVLADRADLLDEMAHANAKKFERLCADKDRFVKMWLETDEALTRATRRIHRMAKSRKRYSASYYKMKREYERQLQAQRDRIEALVSEEKIVKTVEGTINHIYSNPNYGTTGDYTLQGAYTTSNVHPDFDVEG